MTVTATTLPMGLARSRPRRRSIFASDAVVPWFYLLPVLVILGVWIFFPLGRALYLSFYEWNLLPTAPMRWKGIDNYIRLLSLPDVRISLLNTAIYILGLLPLSVLLPIAVAIVTHDLTGPMRNLYRALIFVPMIIAPVVVAVLWRWLLNPDHGIVNAAIASLGGDPVGFLEDRGVALWTIVWITGWKLIGFSTLIFAAANANIDHNYIEAARLDGASEWRIVRDIRLPLLWPTTMFMVMMTILLGAQWSFTYINVLTQGGPRKATTNIYYLLWDYGFGSMSVGWASAAGIILFVGFAGLAFLFLRLINRKAVYDN